MVPRNSTMFTFFTGRCVQVGHETKCTTPKVHMYKPYHIHSVSLVRTMNLLTWCTAHHAYHVSLLWQSRQWNEPQSHLETSADITASTHLLIHPLIHPFFPFLSSVSTSFQYSPCISTLSAQFWFSIICYLPNITHHYIPLRFTITVILMKVHELCTDQNVSIIFEFEYYENI